MPFKNLKNIVAKNTLIELDIANLQITIKEPDKVSKLKEVIVDGLNSSSCGIKFQKTKKQSNQFLNGHNKEGINMGCDSILFLRHNNRTLIIFMELKSEKLKPKDYEKQLVSSWCFVKYLEKLLHEFYKDTILENVEYKYVLFYKGFIPKSVMRPGSLTNHSVERMRNYPDRDLIKIPLGQETGNYKHINSII